MLDYQKAIIEYIAREGITQDEFAAMAEVSSATVSRWLSSNHGISKKHLNRIMFITGVPLDNRSLQAAMSPETSELVNFLESLDRKDRLMALAGIEDVLMQYRIQKKKQVEKWYAENGRRRDELMVAETPAPYGRSAAKSAAPAEARREPQRRRKTTAPPKPD